MKIYLAQINPTIGHIPGNVDKILIHLNEARKSGADIILFPELAITGYPPEDLLLDTAMILAAESALIQIQAATKGIFAVVGLPRRNPSNVEKPLYNSAAIFADGELLGFRDKILLPTYDVFDERRFFEPGAELQPIYTYKEKRIAITICEDCWQHMDAVGDTHYRCDPILSIRSQKPDLLLNLSASPYSVGHPQARIALFGVIAKTLNCPLIFCNQVGANDQLIFDGNSFCMDPRGTIISAASAFHEEGLLANLSASPILPFKETIQHLYGALVLGVRDYFYKQGFSKAILGLSGGLDSALVACIAVEALGKNNLSFFYLPSRFSSPMSEEGAQQLAANLDIPLNRISIEPFFEQFLKLFPTNSPTTENLQARLRAILLMAFSNETNALLLNTGNKSELAMGYTTLYGDLCGGLGVLLDVVKTRVYELSRYVNRAHPRIPEIILSRAPSAELRPNQTDEETLPPYELLDQVIEDYIEQRLSPTDIALQRAIPLELVEKIIRQIHQSEYKRRQAPIGLRVTPKSFSKGRNSPIVQRWR